MGSLKGDHISEREGDSHSETRLRILLLPHHLRGVQGIEENNQWVGPQYETALVVGPAGVRVRQAGPGQGFSLTGGLDRLFDYGTLVHMRLP